MTSCARSVAFAPFTCAPRTREPVIRHGHDDECEFVGHESRQHKAGTNARARCTTSAVVAYTVLSGPSGEDEATP